MANWLTPKTDWAAEDGVMNTDFNRIEENIQYLYDESGKVISSALRQNVTVYVSATGDDSTGNGSTSAPFRTVSKAIQSIPKNLNGFTASVYVYAGTYNESVEVIGYFGGTIKLTGPAGSVTLSGLTVADGSRISVDTITLLVNGMIIVRDAGYFSSTSAVTVSSGTYGVYVGSGGVFIMDNTIIVNATTTFAVFATTGARISLSSIRGSGNNVGFYANLGGTISYSTSALGATTSSLTEAGGRVYSGAQTNVPNY